MAEGLLSTKEGTCPRLGPPLGVPRIVPMPDIFAIYSVWRAYREKVVTWAIADGLVRQQPD